ncbi:MAG TPA: hypothetical protein VFK30_14865, partial [Anaerolineae bacterium]|nr:hypothetical protein [Anaerolineae bacterium]
MTKQQPGKKSATRDWLLKTVMMSIGIAALMAAFGFIALNAVDVPSFDLDPAQAAFKPPVTAIGPAASTASPFLTNLSSPEATPTQTQTPLSTAIPSTSSTPIETPLPTITATRVIKPLPTATLHLAVHSVAAQPVVVATATPMPTGIPRVLDFSFYIRSITCAGDASRLFVDVMITAHGGQPPYNYYNDMTLIGQN